MTPPPLLQVLPGGKLRLNLHDGQLKAWDSTRRFITILAGTQSGKTSFLSLWLYREMMTCGPGDYGFVSPTFTLMEQKALPDFKRLFKDILGLGEYSSHPVPCFTVSPEGEARLFGKRQPEKTTVSFRYAANPDSLESSTWKAAVLDEAGQDEFKSRSYDAILRRLSIAAGQGQGRVLIGTTPYQAGGWLKTRIHDRWTAGDPDYEVVSFASTMNPAFPQAEFDRAMRDLPRWQFDLFYRGILTRPPGLIYGSFDTTKHLARRFPIPSAWPRYLGLDFGAVNTAAVSLAGELNVQGVPTGRLFIHREYHPARKGKVRLTPEQHVKELLLGEPGVPMAAGGSASEDDWRGQFSTAGLWVMEPPIKDVEVGIARVDAAFARGELILFDDLEDLRGEIETYRRVLNDAGEPTEKIEEKETFHLLDSLRYIISHLKAGDSGSWDPTPDPAAKLEVFRAPKGVWNTDASGEREKYDIDDLTDDGPGFGGFGGTPLIPDAW